MNFQVSESVFLMFKIWVLWVFLRKKLGFYCILRNYPLLLRGGTSVIQAQTKTNIKHARQGKQGLASQLCHQGSRAGRRRQPDRHKAGIPQGRAGIPQGRAGIDAQKAASERAMLGDRRAVGHARLCKETLNVELGHWEIEATPYGTFARMMNKNGRAAPAAQSRHQRQLEAAGKREQAAGQRSRQQTAGSQRTRQAGSKAAQAAG
jgi:hypothetical protein